MDELSKSYYAIIPADVRYNKSLSANAKLLYGEITALCNEKGFCWAGNEYFSGLYAVSERTIQRWINQLSGNSYIIVNYRQPSGISDMPNRCISLGDKNVVVGDKNVGRWVTKMSQHHDKNVTHNNTSNNTSEYIKELSNDNSKKSVTSLSNMTLIKTVDAEFKSDKVKQAFMDFVDMRKSKGKTHQVGTERCLKQLISKLKELANTEEEAIAILEQSIERNYNGLFQVSADKPKFMVIPKQPKPQTSSWQEVGERLKQKYAEVKTVEVISCENAD